jgi:hypothetical protein
MNIFLENMFLYKRTRVIKSGTIKLLINGPEPRRENLIETISAKPRLIVRTPMKDEFEKTERKE